jgi:saccharopine dehydrogenase-like NADP-dependent oxidoreductase
VQDSAKLKSIIYTSDIVISYVPAFLHMHVAKACLELGKNMITASYITKELQDMDQEVKAKGLIFLNEMGLDPGIDHLATMKVIDEVREQNGKIIEYESWCGGLPSPTCCDNPLGYKFTWSPIGAFRALKNKAVYIDNGKSVEIEPRDLLYSSTEVRLNQALTLEGYPNRDSLSYRDVYGLNYAKKFLRGTLRYTGFTELINAFKEIGFWSEEPVKGETWLEYTKILLSSEEGATL